MRHNMNYGDILGIVHEMQSFVGFRVQSIYDITSTEFLLKLRDPILKQYRYIIIKSGYYIFETSNPPTNRRMMPSGIAMTLRKYTSNKRISDISIVQTDRIIKIDCGEQDTKYTIIVELYGKGNIILLHDTIVITALTKYSHIQKGIIYKPDINSGFQPDIQSHLDKNKLINTYGPNIAKEILHNMEIHSIDMITSISTVFKWISNQSLSGYIALLECVPYKYTYLDTATLVKHNSFSQAIQSFLPKSAKSKETVVKKQLKSPMEKMLESNLNKQKGIQAYILKLRNYITLLEYNQPTVEGFLSTINPDMIYGKDRLIKITIDCITIPLFVDNNFYQNLTKMYQTIKLKQRIFDKTIIGMEKAAKNIEQKQKTIKKPNTIILKHDRWYHQFHWFYTSHGYLAVCGKNSEDNETLVKKYMESHDLYFHSEVSGSGSCILKNPDKTEVPISDLEQVGQFVVCRSNAWKPKIMYNAYWVNPSQVSKTTFTGEYVEKGAFIIRGTKNYIKNISFELGISLINYNSEKEIMVSPYRTILNLDRKNRMKIVPGNHKRKKGIDKVIKFFALDKTAYDLIDKIIPYHFMV